MNTKQVKEAVKGCKCLLSRLVSISRDTHSVDHVDFLHLEVLINLAQSYLSASELGEEVHGKHDHCFDIDGDFCIKCGEDVDIHPAYVRGYNAALSHARLVVAKLKAEIAEKDKQLEAQAKQIPSDKDLMDFIVDYGIAQDFDAEDAVNLLKGYHALLAGEKG